MCIIYHPSRKKVLIKAKTNPSDKTKKYSLGRRGDDVTLFKASCAKCEEVISHSMFSCSSWSFSWLFAGVACSSLHQEDKDTEEGRTTNSSLAPQKYAEEAILMRKRSTSSRKSHATRALNCAKERIQLQEGFPFWGLPFSRRNRSWRG